MNTTKKKTLKLNRETLRSLSNDELAAAQGGSELTQGGTIGSRPTTWGPGVSGQGGLCTGSTFGGGGGGGGGGHKPPVQD